MKKIITAMLVIIFTFITIPLPIESETIHINPIVSQPDIKPIQIDKPIIKEENNNYITMRATAYTKSKEEGTYDGITASGTQVSRGSVAVDPRRIPLGTKLYIEGYGHAVACDTGGDIKHDRIDLYMETKKEAFEFGRQSVRVWIIE